MENESKDQNPERRPGMPVSSLMQLQKEKSPKSVPTRPAGLRRGAEEENKCGKSGKSTAPRKATPGKEGDDQNPERRPGTPLSSLMQLQKEKSPKSVHTRPAGLRRGAEKENKAGKSGKSTAPRKATPGKEGDDQNPERRPGTPLSSLMQLQKEKSPKTVHTRPAGLRRGAEEEKRHVERILKAGTQNGSNSDPGAETKLHAPQRTFAGILTLPQHHSFRNQLSGLYKNSTTEVRVVE